MSSARNSRHRTSTASSDSAEAHDRDSSFTSNARYRTHTTTPSPPTSGRARPTDRSSVRNAPRISSSARPARSMRAGASGQARNLPGAPPECDRRRLWLAPDIGGGSLRATKGGMPAPHRSTPAASARPVIVQLADALIRTGLGRLCVRRQSERGDIVRTHLVELPGPSSCSRPSQRHKENHRADLRGSASPSATGE